MVSQSERQAENAIIQKDLQILQKADAYRQWIFATIRPWLGRRILEIGAGIGNYTEKLFDREVVWATDRDSVYVEELRGKFAAHPAVRALRLDLGEPGAPALATLRQEGIDTVVILNVLEHVEDDLGALGRMRDVLGDGGRIVVVVPALQWLYGSLDRSYEHFRRYHRRDFACAAAALGMRLEHCRYFNLAGIAAWWLNTKLQRRESMSLGQVLLFERFIPLFQAMERCLPPPIGLSLLAVLRKPGESEPLSKAESLWRTP